MSTPYHETYAALAAQSTQQVSLKDLGKRASATAKKETYSPSDYATYTDLAAQASKSTSLAKPGAATTRV